MGSQPAGHVGVGGLAEVQSSGTEVEFDAVAWRLEADVAADADGLGAAEFADDVGEFGGWVEFSVEGAEPAGGFGVVSQPGVPCSAGGVEFVSLILEPANGQRFGCRRLRRSIRHRPSAVPLFASAAGLASL